MKDARLETGDVFRHVGLEWILQDGDRVEAFGEPFVAFRVACRSEMSRERIGAHILMSGGGHPSLIQEER